MLKAISPIDGRYASKTIQLQDYFSEYALIKYRVYVEIQYLIALSDFGLDQVKISTESKDKIANIFNSFSEEDAAAIKSIERKTNHDVKAVEYFIKTKLDELGLNELLEFVHFALTSQDINNTVLPLQLRDANAQILLPQLQALVNEIKSLALDWIKQPMLARTHGQPASPTTMGKEWMVFVDRLEHQISTLSSIRLRAKFGGATGQFNAHVAAYPEMDWPKFADDFINNLGLDRSYWTTQIAHYDDHSELFHAWARISTILKDMCMDVWSYVSMNYFTQKTVAGEVGSSAMPHKVNPIDFENAEGNLGLAIAILDHLANKLPISRLQRDLTDSTVARNIGVPMAHIVIAMSSIKKGLGKLVLNSQKLNDDLDQNWAVVAEAIQNILRREGFPKPYEALKDLTRGQEGITQNTLHSFIDQLKISDQVKSEMKAITPHNYLGVLGLSR